MIGTEYIKINWTREQSDRFGLDYISKFGTFANYEFDIRYDYDGDASKKPDCGVSLGVWATYPAEGKRWPRSIQLEHFSCFTIDSAVAVAEKWLKQESEKFIPKKQ